MKISKFVLIALILSALPVYSQRATPRVVSVAQIPVPNTNTISLTVGGGIGAITTGLGYTNEFGQTTNTLLYLTNFSETLITNRSQNLEIPAAANIGSPIWLGPSLIVPFGNAPAYMHTNAGSVVVWTFSPDLVNGMKTNVVTFRIGSTNSGLYNFNVQFHRYAKFGTNNFTTGDINVNGTFPGTGPIVTNILEISFTNGYALPMSNVLSANVQIYKNSGSTAANGTNIWLFGGKIVGYK